VPKIVIYKPENCYPPQREGTQVGFDRIRLKSGVNHLSDEKYQDLAQHPSFPEYADRKALVVQEEQSEVQTVPFSEVPKDLTAYNTTEADAIIDGTHDKDVLNLWLKADARAGVRKAINQRLLALSKGEG
jgi:hypothetical protein